MKNKIHLIFLLFFCISIQNLFAAGILNLTIKPLKTNGKIESLAWATIELDGQQVDMVATEKGKGLLIELEFDKNYIIHIKSKNYEPLDVNVNTYLSKADKPYNYEYSFTFEMIESKKGMEPKYQVKPNILIKYNKTKQNFATKTKYNPVFTYVPKKHTKSAASKEGKPIEEKTTNKENPKIPKEVLSSEKPKEEKVVEVAPVEKTKDSIPTSKEEVVEERPNEIKLEKMSRPIVDVITPISQRQKLAKRKMSEIASIKAEEEEDLLKILQVKTKSKRSFLEDVSNSKIRMKQIERNYQHSK